MRWALCALERNPHALFYESELRAHFGEGFDAALEAGLLRFVQPLDRGGTICTPDGRRLSVFTLNGELWGLDDEEPEAEPVPVALSDLSRYSLAVESVAERLREANGLQGEPCGVGDHLHYVGFREQDGVTTAVLLAFFLAEQAALETALSVPSRVSGEHAQYILACPSFALRDQEELRRLQDARVFLCGLSEQDVWQIEWPRPAVDAEGAPSGAVLLAIRDGGMDVLYGGQVVTLSPVERKVLLALAASPRKAVATGDLGRAGRQEDGPSDLSAVRTAIGQLRAKFARAAVQAAAAGVTVPENPIRTRRGRHQEGGAYELTLHRSQVAPPDEDPR